MMTEQGNTKQLLDTLALRIREKRKAMGLTQEQLAELAGVSTNFLARMEMSDRTPSLSTLSRLANALRVQVADLLTSSSGKAGPVPPSRTHYLDATLASLSPEDNELVVQMLTLLVRRLKNSTPRK